MAMTEQEYVDATNLCRARLAAQVMREYLPQGDDHDSHAVDAAKALAKLCDSLEKRVHLVDDIAPGK